MKSQLFDIVMMRPERDCRIYCIVEMGPDSADYEFLGLKLDKGPISSNRYRVRERDILFKIGTMDPETLKLDLTAIAMIPPLNWRNGRNHAEFMAQNALTDLECQRWAILAKLSPGDPILIDRDRLQGSSLEKHFFQEVHTGRPQYCFAAMSQKGSIACWKLEALSLETTCTARADQLHRVQAPALIEHQE